MLAYDEITPELAKISMPSFLAPELTKISMPSFFNI